MSGVRVVSAAAVLAGLAMVFGADPPGDEEKGVRAAIESYVKAFNAGDAAAVAGHWADDAEYVLPSGERVKGREAIAKGFTALFAGPKPKVELIELRVRLAGDGTAIEEGLARVTAADRPPEETRYLAVHVKKMGAWKLAAVHETAVPAPPASLGYEHLKELEWLVGDWHEESEAAVAENSFQWTRNRAFLTCRFHVPMPDRSPFEGTQVIGWDAESNVVRSWLFDSEGGFGEGLWTRSGDQWTVRFVQVLPDGRRASSTNIYNRLDGDTFQWKSIGRKVDGKFVDNIGPVKLLRKTAGKGAEESKEK